MDISILINILKVHPILNAGPTQLAQETWSGVGVMSEQFVSDRLSYMSELWKNDRNLHSIIYFDIFVLFKKWTPLYFSVVRVKNIGIGLL